MSATFAACAWKGGSMIKWNGLYLKAQFINAQPATRSPGRVTEKGYSTFSSG
jgi:hypothetical protein